jgi:hypothetical protein
VEDIKASGRKASGSFFEKKEPKKLFPLGSRGRLLIGQPTATRTQWIKSFFASFCSQKEDSCLPFLPPCLAPARAPCRIARMEWHGACKVKAMNRRAALGDQI